MQPSLISNPNSASSGSSGRRILRLPEVMLRAGFKRAHIYNLINQGRFPRSIQLGARAVGWDSLAVDRWIEQRLAGDSIFRSVTEGAV
ncbi:AlpA family transcriptional regulator [Pseudomonas fluorescens]|uniref:AlpA family transcriptional regulator n=1 Tax=Pseudomonas fluorescens TaxID=294 RepID=UPI00123FCD25|nr:AlpA family transcriptional regulator [Pseudomonas fluorescens]